MFRLLVLLIALGCTTTLVQSVGAQEPATETPPPPEPTRTPRPDEGTLIIHVVNDLNRNGRRDAGEPGLEGWRALLGCSDAFVGTQPSDGTGTTVYFVGSRDECVALDVQFGWVPTATRQFRMRVAPGGTEEVTFLVRSVGEHVQQVFGEVILNGLPAPVGSIVDALVGSQSCSDAADLLVEPAVTYDSLYVLSADDRSGCAGDAKEVSFAVDGTVALRKRFAPGTSGLLDLIAGPAPMRFNAEAPEGTVPVPYVGSIVCGEARSYGGILVPANAYRIYVLPEALRTGCGAPGRIVTVRAGGAVILTTAWQEGIFYDLTVLTPVLPDAGSQPGSEAGSLTLGLAALAVAASALTALLGGGFAEVSSAQTNGRPLGLPR